MTQLLEEHRIHLSNFKRFEKESNGDALPWLDELRKSGMARFEQVGFPGDQDEHWRHTNLKPIIQTRFDLASADASHEAIDRANEFSLGRDATSELVFINGQYNASLSKPGKLPRGVIARSLAEAIETDAERIQRHLARYADIEANPFVALNTGFVRDGVFLFVPRGVTVEQPIHLLFVDSGGASPTVSHPRILVVAEENAELTVVQSFIGAGGVHWANSVTEIVAGDDSRVEFNRLQHETPQSFHVSTMQVQMGRSAKFVSQSATLGGRVTRNDLNCVLAGERGEATMNGLVILTGEEHCDNHTLLDHAAPNCPSHELYKHVLSDKSSAVFKGKILVRQIAQKTDSKQTSKALLLSDDAAMNSQPALEIYADDVKCTHGSTTGPVDDDMLFYLRTRGVDLQSARHLLTYAFAADITRRLRVEPFRRRLEDFMAQQAGLPQDLRITDFGARMQSASDVAFTPSPRRGEGWGEGRNVNRLPHAFPPHPNPLPSGERGPDMTLHALEPAVAIDVEKVRADFPILQTKVHGRPLIYLDNGATTQKPRQVLDAIERYYESQNANIHRGVYTLSQLATSLYEETRTKICKFINAQHDREIIYTRGTTESINLVASSFGRSRLRAGDEVVVSAMEHHSNIVPWQMLCEATGAKLRVIPMNERGELLLDELEKILSGGKVKIISVVHLSNSLGTINDVERITELAHAAGAKVMIDGAQWVGHHKTDVRALNCDFYSFSGHKLFGPTGIGVLYGKAELLEAMPPYQGGGDMIASVTFEKTTYADLPNKFEAGTPDIAGVVGLGAAIDYLCDIGFANIEPHEADLLVYATQRMSEVPGLRVIGQAAHKGSVISFVLDDPPMASHDIGVVLDMEGVAVRTGHHCCQPAMDRLGIPSTARVSLAMYNTRGDIDVLVAVLLKATAHAKPRIAKSDGQIEYPQASAASPQAAAESLAEVFDFLGNDTNARNQFLMDDLGAKLPNRFDLLKQVTPRLQGCMSEVYFVGRRSPRDRAVLEFVADANAAIVRGEIVMLQRLFSGQKANEILAFDIEGFFRRIGLEQFLTVQRRTGMASMVSRIKELAQGVASAPTGN